MILLGLGRALQKFEKQLVFCARDACGWASAIERGCHCRSSREDMVIHGWEARLAVAAKHVMRLRGMSFEALGAGRG